jgi:threonine dehydrogenase-like Zn-dependent dehydrogenase
VLACVVHETRRVFVEDREPPSCPPDHALVAIGAAGICGTDVHIFDGTIPVDLPRVPGHDCAGVLVEDAGTLQQGARVLIRPSFPCRRCERCLSGAMDECPNKKLIGLHLDGAMQGMLAVPMVNLLPLPDDVTLVEAANLEPFTVALNMVNRLGLTSDDRVVVLGQGPIGLALTQLLRPKGCRILATDVRNSRLLLAEEYGAKQCVNARTSDVGEEVDAFTNGAGANVVIETTGVPAVARTLLSLVGKGGQVGLIGYRPDIGTLDIAGLIMKALTVVAVGGNGGRGRYEEALQLLRASMISLRGITTHTFAAERAEEAFELAARGEEGVGRITLTFEGRA